MWCNVLVGLVVACVVAEGLDYIDTLDDEFDFNAISSEEYVKAIKCIIDKGPCSDLTASYRKHYPDAIIEACARCNKSQKNIMRVFLERARKEFPDLYREYWQKWDPQGKYFANVKKSIGL